MALVEAPRSLAVVALVISLSGLLSAPAPAFAQEDCDTPDDLCVGDPCVISTVFVDDSCVLDFGPRTVEVKGRIVIPPEGELDITAGNIIFRGLVQNLRPQGPLPLGPRVTFRSTGDLLHRGRVRLNGAKFGGVAGSVTFDADGLLTVKGAVVAFTSPTDVSYRSGGGDLSFTGRVRTPKGASSFSLDSAGAIELRGAIGGVEDLDVVAVGNVGVLRRITPLATFDVTTAGVITLDAPLVAPGLVMTLAGDAGIVVEKRVKLVPLFLMEGVAHLTASAGSVAINHKLIAIDIDINAADDVLVGTRGVVSASTFVRSGGTVDITTVSGDVVADGSILAQPGDAFLDLDGAGGQVTINAAGSALINGDILVNGWPQNFDAPGGAVVINADEIHLDGKYDADGHPPGPQFAGYPDPGVRLTSSVGSISVTGVVEARNTPSVVQFDSAADLTLDGRFEVAPTGCIGLSAVGTIDTTAATFDTAPVTTCP